MYLGSAHRNTVAADLFCTSYLYIPLEATVESLQVALYDAGRARNATKSIIAFLLEILIAFFVFVFVGHACVEYAIFTKSTKIIVQSVGQVWKVLDIILFHFNVKLIASHSHPT